MKPIFCALITLFSLSSSMAWAAQSNDKFSILGSYFGIAQGWVEIEENNKNNQYEMYTFDFIAGMNFHPNLGVEGRLGFGGSDNSGSSKYSLDHYLSFYTKPQYTFGRLNTYALLGASFVSSETSQRGIFVDTINSYDEFSFSYGAGAIYYFKMIMIGLEYVKVLDKDRIDIDRGGLLFGFRF